MPLYDFQEGALKQLDEHERATGDRSAMIGDDMGLGKTVEAIVLDVRRRERQPNSNKGQTLIVTMTSVMGSWEEHYKQWAPHLKVMVIDRKNRSKFIQALKMRDGNGLPVYHVFVCHWAGLRFIQDDIKGVYWFHVIGDEIQNIKNRKAQQTQVFKKLKTYYKTGLSGTWADNRPDDAWSPLNWLWPNKWRSYWGFFNHHVIQKHHNKGYCNTCDNFHPNSYNEILGVHDAELIHDLMGKAYVRRTKEEVIKDLPEKTYEDLKVELSAKERRIYDEMARDMLAWVGKHEDEPIAAPAVIAQLVRLQQFACAYGRKEVRYKNVEGERMELEVVVLDEPSAKLDAVMEIVERTNGQLVVFAQSKQVINLLASRLRTAKISHGILTGDTKQEDRDQIIRQFQSGGLRVFAGTIKAGGVGITLTAAQTMVFIDRDWSPTKNRQAEDRIHRLGQKNACLFITLVARRTIDRERNDKIAMKWEWLKQILNPEKENA